MKLLALDTATEACSAAIYIDGETYSRYELAPRQHAELILPMVDSLFTETGIRLQELDAIAYGCGPGAFTGVRIATGVAQGLGFASDRPLIPVSTLAALAWEVRELAPLILPAIDARMNEIYCALYRTKPEFELLQPERVCPADTTGLQPDASCYGTGSGWKRYEALLANTCKNHLAGFNDESYPHAEHMLQLALVAWEKNRIQNPADAAPIYLRDKVTG